MSESALVIVDNHKKMEYYYCHEGGSIDTLGVEICLNLHEPNYFYSADESDWKDGFSHFFKGFRFQKYKKFPSDLTSIECVYHISFGKENVAVVLCAEFESLKEWSKGRKQRIFQTDFLTGYKSRLRTLCIENF